ncbi:MAG: transcription-repair coupling factor [Gammaproteobacteria bacterium]|nr:transcription-repair coupling factor [Gammaproteobacteria bacterium]
MFSGVPGSSPLEPDTGAAPGERRFWFGLHGSSVALAVASATARLAHSVLVLAAGPAEAVEFTEELNFYLGDSPALPVLSFPSWETLPYDAISPYQDIVSERLATLERLPDLRRGVLVIPVATIMHRLLPGRWLRARSFRLRVGEALARDAFRRRMQDGGYAFVSQVSGHGEVAVRGSLIDVFPMGSPRPFRIDLLDDVVDSIRLFDPESQRSAERVSEVAVMPAREVALTEEGIAYFRSRWRSRFEGNPSETEIYSEVSLGNAPPGIEYYLPLFYERTESLFDYLHGGCTVVQLSGAREAAESFWSEIQNRYEQGRHDRLRPLLAPAEVFIPPEEFSGLLRRYPSVLVAGVDEDRTRTGAVVYATRMPASIPVDGRARDPLAVLRRFLEQFHGRVLIAAESVGRRETLLELLARHGLRPVVLSGWAEFLGATEPLALAVAPLENGIVLVEPPLAVISESQLFGERAQQRRLRRRRQDAGAVVRDLAELQPGAPVVHQQHGVGRYLGLMVLEIGNIPGEFICMEYQDGDKLYVPVAALDLISRYTGVDPEHAPLHRLGSGQWDKARRRAAERAADVAAELLEIHARRAARPGHAFVPDADAYQSFTQGFRFEETPDQRDAIDAVVNDMGADRPMDRLICGDAGFGKTEVAMRAAFVAVQDQRQVALLVPTTLLAQQHLQNFRDRFADWPIRVETLSRFVGRARQQEIIADTAAGKVDILIGTHRLLQADVKFARLGLAIIDEEHRFGVRQKERLKAMRAEVDVLTLTATPIPRTLNLALSDLRELSIISTPPARRLAVRTLVREWHDGMLREAMQRELHRGGQIYFLHNEVESIAAMGKTVQSLAPEGRVRIAHGRMPERELEQVMLDFYHRRFQVLVCTTIIETGIDVPNANTIVINRADKFGLAQLYQLRGRVGRSHHRAYAYLLIPPRAALAQDAMKRLEAIESLEELGIGFTLATHDLEIRGAGEILGEEQSGQIQEVGFAMYMDLLDRAVRSLRSGRRPELDRPLDTGVEINLHVPALIPEDYLPDVHSRLVLYKRIAGASDEQELTALREEIIDRFGALPEPLRLLLRTARLKQQARPLGVRKIDYSQAGGRVHFHGNARIDGARLVRLLQEQPAAYRMDGRDKLRLLQGLPDADGRLAFLGGLFETLQQPAIT